jgi:hypothetical protein
MESNNLLPEFSIEPCILDFKTAGKPLAVLTVQQVKLEQAKNNCVKVQSVCLPKRITDPDSKHGDINDWFASLPIPREYPMDVIPPSYILELSNNRIF